MSRAASPRHGPTGEQMPIYDAAMAYRHDGTPLVVIAGKEYGTGSSRDWAAKGTVLLGVRAVIAESFERIHRSNLVGMGVLPLQFRDGESAESSGSTAPRRFTIPGVADIQPRQDVEVEVTGADGSKRTFTARCRIDTSTSSNISAPAASSIMCCGGWRRRERSGAGRHMPLRASPHHLPPQARTKSRTAIAACARRPASRASISPPTSSRSRARSTAMCGPTPSRPTSLSCAAAIAGSSPTGRR